MLTLAFSCHFLVLKESLEILRRARRTQLHEVFLNSARRNRPSAALRFENEDKSPKGKSQIDFSTWLLFNAGNYLLSHTLSRAVQSAQRGLTSVFGMGTGGSPAVRSPTT